MVTYVAIRDHTGVVVGILVIEEGHPNGADLVMGEHLLNGVAKANAVPQKQVQVVDIGEGYCVVGIGIQPTLVMEGEETSFCGVITLIGGRRSDIVPMMPVKLVVGELFRLPLGKLREQLAATIDGPKEAENPQ